MFIDYFLEYILFGEIICSITLWFARSTVDASNEHK